MFYTLNIYKNIYHKYILHRRDFLRNLVIMFRLVSFLNRDGTFFFISRPVSADSLFSKRSIRDDEITNYFSFDSVGSATVR